MVAPSIYGEPLLIPNLREVITDLKRRGTAVAMNTNGLTLTEDIASFFCEIGVDSAANFYSRVYTWKREVDKFAAPSSRQ